jgi:D-glycero-D-manno-heptose 1,7-bisphosphate phosphatase
MLQINKGWTLFLDRDGVINVERNNDYVYEPEQFHFYEGVLDTLYKCAQIFDRIIIVTNQRGVGRGLMTERQLADVHHYMYMEIKKAGGRIDKIYYATDVENNAPNRKPNTGMADQAIRDFPEINFEQSIMIGNNISDMEFGKHKKMQTVFVRTTKDYKDNDPLIDYSIPALSNFLSLLEAV